MVLAVPEFDERVNCQRFHKTIEVLEGDGAGSIYQALSSDVRRGHGLAPSFWVFDEFAQSKTDELLHNLQSGSLPPPTGAPALPTSMCLRCTGASKTR